MSIQKAELFGEPAPAEGELDDVLRFVVERCAAVTAADMCTLHLFDKGSQELKQMAEFWRVGADGGADDSLRTDLPYITQAVVRSEASFMQDRPSIICLPIKARHDTMGTLCVCGYAENAFGPEQRLVLESILDGVPASIERAYLRDSLLQIARMMTGPEDLESFLSGLVRLTRDLLREPICLVWFLDKDRNGFALKQWAIPGQQSLDGDVFVPSGASEVQELLRAEEPQDAIMGRRALCDSWACGLAMPLRIDHRSVGVLEVFPAKQPREFTQWHRHLFKTLAVQASLAIKSITRRVALAQLTESLQKLSNFTTEPELLDFTLATAVKLSQ